MKRNYLWCLVIFALFSSLLPVHALRFEQPPNGTIRTAPAAPLIPDEVRRAELARRRARVAERIGPQAVLVLFSAEPRVYSNDVDYEYRQENNLFYLTHLNQRGIKLVLMPGNPRFPEILFLPRRDPRLETWTGRMYSAEDAQRISGISEIWDAREFEPFMRALRLRQPYTPREGAQLMGRAPSANVTPTQIASTSPPLPASAATGYETLFTAARNNQAVIHLLLPFDREVRDGGESREFRQEQRFAAHWAQGANGYAVRSAWPIFTEMRVVKSPMELQLMQHAIDITIEALQRAMAMASEAQWEYEVRAEVEYVFRRRNAFWGYPSIVGCGPNATTLHYEEARGPIKPDSLLLMDVGAEYEHYSADITRTFPVSGKFTPAQAEIYNLVLASQEAAMRAVRPGATLSEVHAAAVEKIKDGLLRLGLITDKNSDQYAIWFMHGTSHMLGMNVHDVDLPGAKLAPGMVFTVEPGIYIREDALDNLPDTEEYRRFRQTVRPAFEKYKGIGVRIEDDVLVTENGFKNLSAALPRTTAEIEGFIAKARTIRAGGLRSASIGAASRFDSDPYQRAESIFAPAIAVVESSTPSDAGRRFRQRRSREAMPIFEYVCRHCGDKFEKIVTTTSRVECPSCHSEEVEKQLSVFSVAKSDVDFKGAIGPCRTCGDPRGPGACSLD